MHRAAVNFSLRTGSIQNINNPVVRRQLITVIAAGWLTCFRRFSVSSGYYKGLEEEFKRKKQATDDLCKGVNRAQTDEASGTSDKYYADIKEENPTFRRRKYEGSASSTANSSLSSWSNSNVPSASAKASSVKIIDFAKKCYRMVKDEVLGKPSNRRSQIYDSSSLWKRLDENNATPATGKISLRTDIVSIPVKESSWESFKTKMHGNSAVRHIRGLSKPFLTGLVEIAEDVHEFWETIDHPVINEITYQFAPLYDHYIEPMKRDSQNFTKIYSRDPGFCFPEFAAEVKEMIKPMLNAYLKGDAETLKKNCSPHIIEKSLRERKAYESQDMFFDTKIIHVSEWKDWRTHLMGEIPLIIIRFETQQIYCMRNKHGYIKDGAEDDIVTVNYDLAMEQRSVEEQGEGALYPTWWLRGIRQIYQTQLLV